MIVVDKDVSQNGQTDPVKKYDRVVYHCETDDIWVKIETPQNN